LNRLGVDHKCDGQETDRQTPQPLALARYNIARCAVNIETCNL